MHTLIIITLVAGLFAEIIGVGLNIYNAYINTKTYEIRKRNKGI